MGVELGEESWYDTYNRIDLDNSFNRHCKFWIRRV